MTTFFPVTTLPAPYDIVWCRFPDHKDLGSPGPKPRPAIVLNVAIDQGDASGEGEGEVQLVYGTTNLKLMQRRRDFFVTKLSEMDQCGLNRATRFDLDQMAWIPWAEEWFQTLGGYTSPIIGHLSGHATRLLQFELARRQAVLAAVEAKFGDEP